MSEFGRKKRQMTTTPQPGEAGFVKHYIQSLIEFAGPERVALKQAFSEVIDLIDSRGERGAVPHVIEALAASRFIARTNDTEDNQDRRWCFYRAHQLLTGQFDGSEQ